MPIEKRLAEIKDRKVEIRELIQKPDADLEAIKKELEDLETEERGLNEKLEIAAKYDELPGKVIEKEERNEKTVEIINVLASAEYRSGFLKKMMGREIDDAEKRALTSATSSVGYAIPEQTQNEILRKLKQYAPLLDEITLLQVAGNVRYVVEGTVAEAAKHSEGATITASADTLISVSLAGYEINKLITISKTVATMSINAFEGWLTDMLAEAIANKISSYLITGTGSSEPTGIEKAQTWGASNSVTVTASGSLSAANVQALIGLLPGGYDNGAKILMSKKTLFTDFMPLQDNSKHALVTKEGATYYVYGYPVLFDERVTFHEAYLGNFKKAIVGNLAETVNVTSAFDIKTNSFDYLGSAIFDSKVAIGEAIVKLVKASA